MKVGAGSRHTWNTDAVGPSLQGQPSNQCCRRPGAVARDSSHSVNTNQLSQELI